MSRHHNQPPSLKFAASFGDVGYFELITTLAGHTRKYGRRNLLAIQLEENKQTVCLNKVNSLVSFFFYSYFAFWHFDTQVQVQPYSKLNDTVVEETKTSNYSGCCCHGTSGVPRGGGGGLGGFKTSPKFGSFDKAEPNSLFRGKYIRNCLVFLFPHPS
jgi:hypothetical protein